MTPEEKNLLALMSNAQRLTAKGGVKHYLLIDKGETVITYSNNLVAIERDVLVDTKDRRYIYIKGNLYHLTRFK
jgi:hypothetical protein